MTRFAAWWTLGFIMLTAGGCLAPARPSLRVATLNLAHGRGQSANPLGQFACSRPAIEANLAAIAAGLRRERPDVAALQEADAACDWSGRFDHVAFLAESAGYPCRFHGLHVHSRAFGLHLEYGTALLARRELRGPQTFVFEDDVTDSPKGFVASVIDFAGRPVLVVSLHLHAKLAAARRRQAQTLIEQVRRWQQPPPAAGLPPAGEEDPACRASRAGATSPTPALIIMGDFNAEWKRPDDAVRLIAEALRLQPFQPDSDQLNTWPSVSPTVRVDWILISAELEFREYRCWSQRASDHVGVVADLAWR